MTNPSYVPTPSRRAPRATTGALPLPARLSALALHPAARWSRTESAVNDVLDARLAPYALWLLRLALGVFFLQHVMHAVFGHDPSSASQLLSLPPDGSALALARDALIALALLYGLWPRLAAIVGAATLVVAMATHHAGAPLEFGWQHVALAIAALLAIALSGDGAFALVPSRSGFRRRDDP